MLDHFPNLHIGITGTSHLATSPDPSHKTQSLSGVITYSSNHNTSEIIRRMTSSKSSSMRIVLETDAPYMIPGNIYSTLAGMKGKFPLSHSAMVPWTADYVAKVAGDGWTSERVMKVARENARKVYGV
jgi:TatD DNase family protein